MTDPQGSDSMLEGLGESSAPANEQDMKKTTEASLEPPQKVVDGVHSESFTGPDSILLKPDLDPATNHDLEHGSGEENPPGSQAEEDEDSGLSNVARIYEWQFETAVQAWREDDIETSDAIAYELLWKPDLPRVLRAWSHLLISLGCRDRDVYYHSKEAVEQFGSMSAEFPDDSHLRVNLKLAIAQVEACERDMADEEEDESSDEGEEEEIEQEQGEITATSPDDTKTSPDAVVAEGLPEDPFTAAASSSTTSETKQVLSEVQQGKQPVVDVIPATPIKATFSTTETAIIPVIEVSEVQTNGNAQLLQIPARSRRDSSSDRGSDTASQRGSSSDSATEPSSASSASPSPDLSEEQERARRPDTGRRVSRPANISTPPTGSTQTLPTRLRPDLPVSPRDQLPSYMRETTASTIRKSPSKPSLIGFNATGQGSLKRSSSRFSMLERGGSIGSSPLRGNPSKSTFPRRSIPKHVLESKDPEIKDDTEEADSKSKDHEKDADSKPKDGPKDEGKSLLEWFGRSRKK